MLCDKTAALSVVSDSEELANAKSDFLSVMANEHRLHILILLGRGERSCGDLINELGQSAVAVSRHLTILRENGMIRARRGGKMVYYSLVSEQAARMLDTMAEIYCPSDLCPSEIEADGGSFSGDAGRSS